MRPLSGILWSRNTTRSWCSSVSLVRTILVRTIRVENYPRENFPRESLHPRENYPRENILVRTSS